MAVKSPTAKKSPQADEALAAMQGLDDFDELQAAKKSLGIKDGDPRSETVGQGGKTEVRRGFNITHPMGNFATPENGYGMGISFVKANQSEDPIWFPGFMITFSDAFSQNINKEKVFGRMDPLQVFESTERRISFSWQVVSVSEEEGQINIAKINKLVKAMYPDYKRNDQTGGYNVTTSALIGINFHGLAHGSLSAGQKTTDTTTGVGDQQYLFGYIESLNIDHQFEGGVFESDSGNVAINVDEAVKTTLGTDLEKAGSTGGFTSAPLIAKVINLNVAFSPIHPETLGYDETGQWISSQAFPYIPENTAIPKGNEGIPPYTNVNFSVSDQNRSAYEAYQAELRRQEASILSPQNPWERAGNKIANAYNQTVDFFDSLITTEGEDPNTGL